MQLATGDRRLEISRAQATTTSYYLRDMLLAIQNYATVMPHVLNARRPTATRLSIGLGAQARPVAIFTQGSLVAELSVGCAPLESTSLNRRAHADQ